MNFSQRQADPRRHLMGITFVILLHAFIVYALVTGLAKKVVDVVRAPIDTRQAGLLGAAISGAATGLPLTAATTCGVTRVPPLTMAA